jgi:FkbM family methyltransferase
MNPILVLRHPVVFAQKAVGRLRRRITPIPQQAVMATIGGKIQFEHKPLPFLNSEDLRAMLTGSYDIILCTYLRQALSPGDCFLDVGGNVGYISATAAACVGPTGEVHAFEPLAECFERLLRLQSLNPRYKFVFNQIALGEKEEILEIAFDPQGESRNASLVPGSQGGTVRQVPVQRLDRYILQNIPTPQRIKVIKIDVEGFELAVLRGLEEFLAQTSCRPAIVCEIKPWVVSQLGYTMQDFDQYLKRYGYRCFDMLDQNRSVDLLSLDDMETLLFRAD